MLMAINLASNSSFKLSSISFFVAVLKLTGITTITSIHSPSSEGSHRASSHNEGFSSSSASIDEILRSYSGVHSSSSSVSGDAAASSSSSSGGASASSTATAR
jgi:hypothetical protein